MEFELLESSESRSRFEEHLAEELERVSREEPGLELDPSSEVRHATSILNPEGSEPNLPHAQYSEPIFIGAGGSGLIFSVLHLPTGTRRALKLPRARLYESSRDAMDDVEAASALAVIEDPEIAALAKISHQNVTSLYEAIGLENGVGFFIVTELVEDPRLLSDYVAEHFLHIDIRKPDQVDQALYDLSFVLLEIATAMEYLHEVAGLLHLDIKPANVLLNGDSQPFVIDLGFARDLDPSRYQGQGEIDIGFTEPYAHPDLAAPERGMKISKTFNKAKITMSPKDLHPRFDIFAFGKSIQELLMIATDRVGQRVRSSYTFAYLHLVAALCLDGRNASQSSSGRFVEDFVQGLNLDFFETHRFSSFTEIRHGLERLLDRQTLRSAVPETDPWSSSTINVASRGMTTLTPRVKALLDHPLVDRLRSAKQLGQQEAVFPGATHTRYQHSLGTYHWARRYLEALYYDPDNPVIRVTFREEYGRLLLVASLLHDLGQTSLGHELEEVDRSFDHDDIGARILKEAISEDQRERSIRQLVSGTDNDEWGIEIRELARFLSGENLPGVLSVYREILDSHIDADKLDYLIRDSLFSGVKYGDGIDEERLLRSLTVAPRAMGNPALAIKLKGLPSAEAMALSRYQLYGALYWHHSARAMKAMFVSSTSRVIEGLLAEIDQPELDVSQLVELYVVLAMGIDMGQPKPRKQKRREGAPPSLRNVALEALSKETPPTSFPYGEDPTLTFFWQLSTHTPRAKRVIEDVMSRNLYQRVLEVPLSDASTHDWQALVALFKDRRLRLKLEDDVNRALCDQLKAAIASSDGSDLSLDVSEARETLEKIMHDTIPFVVDLPTRGWQPADKAPPVVIDVKRKYYLSRRRTGGVLEQPLWDKHLYEMTKDAAVFRILAHPEVHSMLGSFLEADDLLETLNHQVKKLRSFLE